MIGYFKSMAKAVAHLALPQQTFNRVLSNHSLHEIELELLPLLVDPARSAIDVGANLGIYADKLSRLRGTLPRQFRK
jgi:hypothetical protein